MTVKTVYQAALRWGIPAACILIIVAMVAGCVNFSPANTGNSGSSSGGSGGGSSGSSAGSAGGGSGGGGAGSGGPYTVVADKDHMKGVFTVNCDLKRVYKDSKSIDIQTAKVNGEVPFRILRNWDKSPQIDYYQGYPLGEFQSEGGAQLIVHSEWDLQCISGDCTPCHFTFDGPVWLDPAIQHKPEDPKYDWSGTIRLGTNTLNDVGEHKMTQYIKKLEPSCSMTSDDAAATLVEGIIQSCFSSGEGNMEYLPMQFGDGSRITFLPVDSYTTLDSTAVFHISG